MKKKALWLIVSIAFPLLALLFIFLGQNIEKYNNLEQMWARNEAFRAFYMLKGFWNEKKVDLKNTTQSAFDIVINPNQSQEDLLLKFGIDKDLLEKTLQKEPFALLNISKDNRKWAIFTVIGSIPHLDPSHLPLPYLSRSNTVAYPYKSLAVRRLYERLCPAMRHPHHPLPVVYPL